MLSTLIRKASNAPRRCALYFYYTAKPHSINPIHHMRLHYQGAAIACLRSKHTELFRELIKFIAASDSTGCEFGDYLELYNTIRWLKPRYALECGSGVSSLVIAYALRENSAEAGRSGKLISLEENPTFHEQVKAIFPAWLNEYVEFVLSPRCEKQYGPYWGSFYENIPEHEYDFMFIDGPTVQRDRTSHVCFNSDIINVLLASRNNQRIDALIDQRIGTYRNLRRLIPGARIRYHPVKKLTRIHGATKASLATWLVEADDNRQLRSPRSTRELMSQQISITGLP
jgi:hypothetical protein